MKKLLLVVALLFIASTATAQAVCNNGGTCNVNNHLMWTIPTVNTDGSPLNDFAGSRVLFGPAPGVGGVTPPAGTQTKDVGSLNIPVTPLPNAVVTPQTLGSLGIPNGKQFVCVKVYDLAGNVSGCSNEVTFVMDNVAPSAPINLNVGP